MINDINDYSRQLAVLKRMVLALPATDGTSREFRTAAIEQLNVCLRHGAAIKKELVDQADSVRIASLSFSQFQSSFFSSTLDAIKGLKTTRQKLNVAEVEVNKLRAMLNTPLAKAYVKPPKEMSNRQVSDYLGVLLNHMQRQGELTDKSFDEQLLQEAIKRLGM